MLALALGRPLGVVDSDCDVELPVDVDDDNLAEYFSLGALVSQQPLSLMAGTNALTGLYKIAGRVLRGVYGLDLCKDHLEPEKRAELQRTVESLDKELTKWCEDLPVEFKSDPVNEKQVSMGAVLFTHYYSILTTLHRNFLPVKNPRAALFHCDVISREGISVDLRIQLDVRNAVVRKSLSHQVFGVLIRAKRLISRISCETVFFDLEAGVCVCGARC